MKFILLILFIISTIQAIKLSHESATHKVQMDIRRGQVSLGTITIDLFGKVVPKTVENFRALCTGEKGKTQQDPEKNLHYKNSFFFKILKGYFMIGGDIIYNNGSGGESIFGKTFRNENFLLEHEKYSVSMLQTNDNLQHSQFLIQMSNDDLALNGRYTVFGKVSKGYDVLSKMEDAGYGVGQTKESVYITDCRVLEHDL